MKAQDIETLHLRLDVLGMVLVELARTLPDHGATRAAQDLGERVTARLGCAPISDAGDECIAADLAPVLSALQRH